MHKIQKGEQKNKRTKTKKRIRTKLIAYLFGVWKIYRSPKKSPGNFWKILLFLKKNTNHISTIVKPSFNNQQYYILLDLATYINVVLLQGRALGYLFRRLNKIFGKNTFLVRKF